MLHKRIDKQINNSSGDNHKPTISKTFYSTSIPLACIGALLFLGLGIINPAVYSIVNNEAYAEAVSATGTAISLTIDGENGGDDDNTEVNGSITANNGDTAYISHNVTVNATNIENYALQLTSTNSGSTSLQHESGTISIAPTTNTTLNDNTWGYSWSNTDSDISTNPYYGLPTYGTTGTSISNGLLESANADSNGNVSFTKKLTFGAKFGNDLPAGHYSTTALLSLAASPKEVGGKSWDELVYMQDMNPAACASQTTPSTGITTVPTKTLTDKRDNNTYAIAKLRDGKCWMTQNLRLVNKTLTSADSDVKQDFVLPASITISSSDNPKKFSSNDRYEKRVYYTGDKNYGAYYNWYTATAGSSIDATTDGAKASNSICPKGWQLPLSGNSSGSNNALPGSYYALLNGLTLTEVLAKPYSYVLGGYIADSIASDKTSGYYWSSISKGGGVNYLLFLYGSNTVGPSADNAAARGHNIRCVSK